MTQAANALAEDLGLPELEALLPAWIDNATPGCAVAVLKGDALLKVVCRGLASLEHGVPIRPNTAFRVASISKQFLCGTIVILSDQGHLGLDDPLGDHLPELTGEAARATLRQAMLNRSGIRDHLELLLLAGGGLDLPHSRAESLALTSRIGATNFPPGSSYLYSNANFLLLTLVAERATGRSLADLLQEFFFQPLGMRNSRLVTGHSDVVENLAFGYVAREEGRYERGQLATELTGEGAIVSTLDDMVLWLKYHRNDPDGLIARLATAVPFGPDNTGNYSLGLCRERYRGLTSVGHSGLWPGYRSEIVRFPEVDIGLVCLANANSVDPHRLNRSIADLLLSGEFPEADPPQLPDTLRQMALAASPFLDPASMELIELVPHKDGAGLAAVMHGSEQRLFPMTERRLQLLPNASNYAAFDFSSIAEGAVRAVFACGAELTLSSVARLPPSHADLSDCVGLLRVRRDRIDDLRNARRGRPSCSDLRRHCREADLETDPTRARCCEHGRR